MKKQLIKNASALVAKGKGILAADESDPTMKKRLDSIKVPSTEENRKAYREILFTTPKAEQYISGVILFDETLRQKASDGTPFSKVLSKKGIIPGIKVDKGAKPMPNSPTEKITEGLDGLRDRCKEYYTLGARFTKWRAVITIGDKIPSRYCIEANAHALARFAALSQEAGLVPIVEPEVLMDGKHTIERCEEVTLETLKEVFYELHRQKVLLEGALLKPNMVLPGADCRKQANDQEIAKATIRCFKKAVPSALPGIVFLSGGQTDIQATKRLNEMNKIGGVPWQLSFSYGRALQAPVLKAWNGKEKNIEKAKKAFLIRARLNGIARYGKYKSSME